MANVLAVAALFFGLLGVIFLAASLRALKHGRVFRTAFRLTLAFLWLSVGMLLGTITIGLQGYRAFTREEVAAVVRTEPIAPKRFRAHFRFANGNEQSFDIAGDELYVDARVLKWKPIANIAGLHTAYQLDRVGGRYRALADEQRAPRTVVQINNERGTDIFDLRQRYTFLAPLLDAEYGSATFVSVTEPQTLEVRVSTTGLLIRPIVANP
jgi:hypothetical protein